ncbi:hypothetical protein V3W47_08310 [Deinococcus sp. YIM 134068]|uniref:hypothetical protein n=1 Tax=Deinococcus lichenicola TaxID=3118910 RepID=UPI002F953D04
MILPIPNRITEGDDFYISYNAVDTSIYGSDSTALVWGEMQGFYILNGDHRERYASPISQGWDACYAYYLAHPELHNPRGDKQFPPLTGAELLELGSSKRPTT